MRRDSLRAGRPFETGSGAAVRQSEDSLPLVQFQLDSAAAARLVASVKKLSTGDSWSDVRNVLGRPTSDQVLTGKEDGRFIVHEVRYDIRRYRVGLVNEEIDEYVVLYFDKDDRLEKTGIHKPKPELP